MKEIIREVLMFFHIDLTKNLAYDRLTKRILKEKLKSNYNCIDVGCHKGEILDLIIAYAPYGTHYGFEPIPYLFEELKKKYDKKAVIFPYALSDSCKTTTFNLVKNAPAYSGLKKRDYNIKHPDISEIEVEVKTLDEIIPKNKIINFIKIDVEGGEYGVLKGAKDILLYSKPTILFECGKGASEYYGTKPADLYSFLTDDVKLKIFTLKAFIKKRKPLTEAQFVDYFNTNKEYYFIASQ